MRLLIVIVSKVDMTSLQERLAGEALDACKSLNIISEYRGGKPILCPDAITWQNTTFCPCLFTMERKNGPKKDNVLYNR